MQIQIFSGRQERLNQECEWRGRLLWRRRDGKETSLQIGQHGAKIANDYMKHEHFHDLLDVQNDDSMDEDLKYEKRAKMMEDAIDLTQTFFAVLITSARGFLTRRRDKFRKALGYCMQREEGWLRKCLIKLHTYVKRLCDVRYHCKRQLYKWQRYTRRRKRIDAPLRDCYGTFYVWRKQTSRTCLYSKAKTMNVVNIFNTYWLLKHFKRFKKYYLYKCERRAYVSQNVTT